MAASNRALQRLQNPEVRVTVHHPPALGLTRGPIALFPAREPLALELAGAFAQDLRAQGDVEVLEAEAVEAALHRPPFSGAASFAGPWVLELGRQLGAATLIAVESPTLTTHRVPLQKRVAWKDEEGAAHARTTHTARTQVRLRAAFRAADCVAGRMHGAHYLEASPSLENHSSSGEAFYPSEAEVRERAFALVLAQARRMFLPWTEARDLVFFDDPEYGLQDAFQCMERQDYHAARGLSLEALERAKADSRAKAKHLCRAHHNAGVCMFVQGDYGAALPYFQAAQDLDPGNGVFRESAAECQRVLRLQRG